MGGAFDAVRDPPAIEPCGAGSTSAAMLPAAIEWECCASTHGMGFAGLARLVAISDAEYSVSMRFRWLRAERVRLSRQVIQRFKVLAYLGNAMHRC